MGYKPDRTFHVLDFSETPLAGLEITMRACSVDMLLDLVTLPVRADEIEDRAKAEAVAGTLDMGEMRKQLRDLFGPVAKLLKSWNVDDDDGQPVPPTLDGLLSQELEFVSQVIEAYTSALSQAPPPLPGTSPAGASSQERSLDLAGASESLPS